MQAGGGTVRAEGVSEQRGGLKAATGVGNYLQAAPELPELGEPGRWPQEGDGAGCRAGGHVKRFARRLGGGGFPAEHSPSCVLQKQEGRMGRGWGGGRRAEEGGRLRSYGDRPRILDGGGITPNRARFVPWSGGGRKHILFMSTGAQMPIARTQTHRRTTA